MKIKEYTGPFAKGRTINVPMDDDYRYVHIGVQYPYSWPIQYLPERQVDPIVQIQPIDDTNHIRRFWVNHKGILEFDGMAELGYTVIILENLPMETIIDIVYSDIQG